MPVGDDYSTMTGPTDIFLPRFILGGDGNLHEAHPVRRTFVVGGMSEEWDLSEQFENIAHLFIVRTPFEDQHSVVI